MVCFVAGTKGHHEENRERKYEQGDSYGTGSGGRGVASYIPGTQGHGLVLVEACLCVYPLATLPAVPEGACKESSTIGTWLHPVAEC